jgi:hypothetical protein
MGPTDGRAALRAGFGVLLTDAPIAGITLRRVRQARDLPAVVTAPGMVRTVNVVTELTFQLVVRAERVATRRTLPEVGVADDVSAL